MLTGVVEYGYGRNRIGERDPLPGVHFPKSMASKNVVWFERKYKGLKADRLMFQVHQYSNSWQRFQTILSSQNQPNTISIALGAHILFREGSAEINRFFKKEPNCRCYKPWKERFSVRTDQYSTTLETYTVQEITPSTVPSQFCMWGQFRRKWGSRGRPIISSRPKVRIQWHLLNLMKLAPSSPPPCAS